MVAESSYIRPGADGRSWTIGNGLVEREVRFEKGRGLGTASWCSLITGTDFVQRARDKGWVGAEFSFVADGEHFAGGNWREGAFDFVDMGIEDVRPSGKMVRLRLQARKKQLQVQVFYVVYDGHPVIRKWIEIRNLTHAPVTISHLVFEELGLAAAAPIDQQLSVFYAVQPREIFFTGRVEDTAILQRNSRSGEGFVVMNEASGWLKRTEMSGWGRYIRVMYDTDLFPFERRIAPGEAFTSAKSSIAFFLEDHVTLDPHWVLPSYTAQILHRGGAGYQPPWVYNTWEPFLRGINAETVHELITVAARMGLDILTIDDGWQETYGENEVNLRSFPGGLDEVRAFAQHNQMGLGLWSPLAVISTKTRAYREHPEWVCRDAYGRPKFTGTAAGMRAVMCLATPYREVAAKRLIDLVGRYHLRYVKLDLTTVFNAYGEAPGCYATGHDHLSWAESLGRIYEGIAEITDQIHRYHPDVLLDLTYELWGQKHLIDYGLLNAGDLDWLSNVDDATPESAGPIQARTLLYQRSRAIPTEAMLIGNLRAEIPPIEERFATVMGSAPLLLGDLRKLTPAQQDWYGERIRWFKRQRLHKRIIEGFFPLGSWLQPDAVSWDGYARLSREGEGLIVIFRNSSGVQKVDVRISAFPEGSFRLKAIMTDMPLIEASGRDLRKRLELKLAREHPVEVFEVSRVPN